MPRVPKPRNPRKRHFIRAWREWKGLRQEDLAARVHLSPGQLSRLERGVSPYNEDLLNALAEALGCEPADLIMREPGGRGSIWTIWEHAKPAEREQISRVAEAVVGFRHKDGTNG